MSIHNLKCRPENFDPIHDRSKNFELRFDDRNFAVGDFLILREYDESSDYYSGRKAIRRISYLATGPRNGLSAGFAILSLDCPFPAGLEISISALVSVRSMITIEEFISVFSDMRL